MSTDRAVTHAPPPAGAWAMLTLVSLAMFGNYYVYDSIAPVADLLQRQLGFSDSELGALNAIYSAPNIVMVLIGGVIVDRFGAGRSTFWFALICLLGAALTAAAPNFPVMAMGRLLFGLGAESMTVAVIAALGLWFGGSRLAFAFGLNVSISRAGSFAADYSPTIAAPLYAQGWQPPLVLAAALAATSLVCAWFYWRLEAQAQQHHALIAPKPSERFAWSDLWRFDRSYWYLVAICVAFYCVIFPFRSTFAIKYFQHAYAMPLDAAGAMNGYVYLAALFATPAFGWMIDQVGRRALFLTVGALLLPASFLMLLLGSGSVWMSTVLIGISFSLVPAALWPAVSRLVEPARYGTAYGLMTLLQNAGLTAANLLVGWLNDVSGASADNPQGYVTMLGFFMALSLVGFVFAMLLRRREVGPQGHGLEARGTGVGT
jgi:MFS family permease